MTAGIPFFKFNEFEIYEMPEHPESYWMTRVGGDRDGEGMQIKKELLRYFLVGTLDTLETIFKERM